MNTDLLTPYFDCLDEPPVRPGVYQIQSPHVPSEDAEFFAKFDGTSWCEPSYDLHEAAKAAVTDVKPVTFVWRGFIAEQLATSGE